MSLRFVAYGLRENYTVLDLVDNDAIKESDWFGSKDNFAVAAGVLFSSEYSDSIEDIG